MFTVKAPLRVSFGGGGTDLAAYFVRFGGLVVSATIERYCYVRVEPMPGQPLEIRSSNYAMVYRHMPGAPLSLDGPLSLPKAVLNHFGLTEGLRLSLAADVAPGTGLGSSSAMTVALIQALAAWQGMALSRARIAVLACEVEIDRLGMPIGYQDQYAAAFGGFNAITFAQEGVEAQPLVVAPAVVEQLEQSLLLFFTGLSRESAAILTEQRQRTEQCEDTLVALHVIKATAQAMKQALESGDLTAFGALLDRGWQRKRRLTARISNPRIDEAYQTARSLGALGGKITGAGGGGFFLLYADQSRHAAIVAALKQRGFVLTPLRFDPHGVTVSAADDPSAIAEAAWGPRAQLYVNTSEPAGTPDDSQPWHEAAR